MSLETLHLFSKLPDETGGCPYCDQAKAWLTEQGIPFEETRLSLIERQALYDKLGLLGSRRTVPQLVLTDCTGEEIKLGGHSALTRSRIETLFMRQD